MDSMLHCCGELGYRRVTVEHVYRHFGGYRGLFYKHFRNKADCFIAAYEAEADWLYAQLARAAARGMRRQEIQVALETLAAYVVEQPTRAKAIFCEVHIAGADALGKRREVLERLSRALDSACRDTRSRHSPPPITAEFMVCVIDQAVSSALVAGRPEQFAQDLPELTALICQVYGDVEPAS